MKGLAFHCHHDTLVEYVYDYDERVDFIKTYKPSEEQELRLRLFRMIPGDRRPKEWKKARAALDKAGAALDKARAAYDKAGAAYDKAVSKSAEYFEQLHKELCPDCPWDGHTIFSEGSKC